MDLEQLISVSLPAAMLLVVCLILILFIHILNEGNLTKRSVLVTDGALICLKPVNIKAYVLPKGLATCSNRISEPFIGSIWNIDSINRSDDFSEFLDVRSPYLVDKCEA